MTNKILAISWKKITIPHIVLDHTFSFSLQSNETKSSPATELEGAKRCFGFLKNRGLRIDTFISDRHKGIAKWIKESQNLTSHFYNIWHVVRSITKKLVKIGKEKDCDIILEWVKAVRNHLYWAATTTKSGFGDLIAAKWSSFMRHVANKHNNHPNNLYQKCSHEETLEPDRNWIKIGK